MSPGAEPTHLDARLSSVTAAELIEAAGADGAACFRLEVLVASPSGRTMTYHSSRPQTLAEVSADPEFFERLARHVERLSPKRAEVER